MPERSKKYNKQFEDKFNLAIQMRNTGAFKEAIEILMELVHERPAIAATFGILGDIFWRMKELEKASDYFKKAIQINPKSELASVSLFHILTEMDKKEEAIEELKRFMSGSKSKEYDLILKENNLELKDL